MDGDPAALKYALWSATDDAYKNALRAYAAKQATLKTFQSAPTANDFTPAKAVTLIEPVVTLTLDREDWKHRLIEASGLFAYVAGDAEFCGGGGVQLGEPECAGGESLHGEHGWNGVAAWVSGYSETVSVGGQAPDGMELGRSNGSVATTAAGLESAAALNKRTIDDLISFNELRHAPTVDPEDYHGPVLFSGDASADVFNRLFVPNVEADRPDMGTSARTQGAYQSSYKTPVLPAFLSVVDDPTLRSFEGHALLGAYKVDDEGVPVEPVDVVVHGKLMNYLIGRQPVKDFPESNGHGRAALGQACALARRGDRDQVVGAAVG